VVVCSYYFLELKEAPKNNPIYLKMLILKIKSITRPIIEKTTIYRIIFKYLVFI
jgi:hypothetical protein